MGHLAIVLLLWSPVVSSVSTNCSISSKEYYALESLYNSTHGQNWVWDPLLSAATIWHFPSSLSAPCSDAWQGLTCTTDCEVVKIELEHRNLFGSIPVELANLTKMEVLNFFGNSLVGTIPAQLGYLTKLKELALESNLLEGVIPTELGNLVNVEDLNLNENSLEGPIPTELGNLVNLEGLSLGANSLVGCIPTQLGMLVKIIFLVLFDNSLEGAIPTQIGFLLKLEELILNDNSLQGNIPTELSNLLQLKTLSLPGNALAGAIPTEFGSLVGMEGLYLYDNSLNGSLPTELGSLIKMKELHLFGNSLEGVIPTELGNLVNIRELYLNENSLQGAIPTELGNLAEMKELALDSNLLEGKIPSQFGRLTNIEFLSMFNNSLEDTIPKQLASLIQLEYLILNSNSLEGSIPTDLGNLTSLFELNLEDNLLHGVIPTELGNLTKMRQFGLGSNFLEGNIPADLGRLAYVEELYIFDNLLEGSIPTELGSLLRLKILSLPGNLLQGNIPTQLGNLVNVETLALNSNSLVGTLPTELGSLVKLGLLGLSFNALMGTIPTQFGNLLNMQALVLSDNSLSGVLPAEIGNLVNLEAVILNSNSLVGKIPTEIGYLVKTIELDLNDNSLEGTLPLSLDALLLLQSMNLSTNKFSGNLDVFAVNRFPKLQFLDLSNNQYSGTLPKSIFSLSELQTIILSQNCFSGSLPSSMCLNPNLKIIILDMLTGNCAFQTDGISSEILHDYLVGTIPACIWNSSSLQTVHFVGNGLCGPLADLSGLSILSTVAIGSNQLTGSIPTSFQRHEFAQLDLSINRFSGTLQPDLYVARNATVFDLSVNRLSGPIPAILFDTFSNDVINVLEGNLFGCAESDIPASDASHGSYQCGSVDLEYSLLSWVAGVVLSVMAAIIIHLRSDWIKRHVKIFASEDISDACVGPFRCLALCLCALAGYVALKAVEANSSTATHAVQYWWTATAAFTHNWGIGIFVFVILVVLCGVFTLTVLSLATKNVVVSNTPGTLGLDVFSCFVAHLINVAVVSGVNAAYVLVVVDKINGFALLAVQAVLGGFKLVWSSWSIPWLISRARISHQQQLSHFIFMVLFVFLGAPFASSFCESSSCFYYLLTAPNMVSFSVAYQSLQSAITCNQNECHLIPLETEEILESSILPPWIYSYQCSSAVITGYAPVLILSYLVSGIIIPLVNLLPLPFVAQEKNSAIARGRSMTIKYIRNFAVMMTFGLAVPFLSVAVLCDTIANIGSNVLLLEKTVASADQKFTVAGANREYWDSFRLNGAEATRCIYIVLGFVSVFWSLFAFDWIADVHGSWIGGLMMLIPLILPTSIGVVLLHTQTPVGSNAISREETSGIELNIVHNPVILPQNPSDDFNAHNNPE